MGDSNINLLVQIEEVDKNSVRWQEFYITGLSLIRCRMLFHSDHKDIKLNISINKVTVPIHLGKGYFYKMHQISHIMIKQKH